MWLPLEYYRRAMVRLLKREVQMSFVTLPQKDTVRPCDMCGVDLAPGQSRGGKHYCDTCREKAKHRSRVMERRKRVSPCDRSKSQPFGVWMWDYLCHDRPDLSESTRRRNLQYLAEFGV